MSHFDEKWAESLRRIAEATESISKNMGQIKPATEVDAADTSRWISLEEREPEGLVLAAAFGRAPVTDKSYIIGYVANRPGSMALGLKETWIAENSSDRLYGITHWMPLPEPPKEEST